MTFFGGWSLQIEMYADTPTLLSPLRCTEQFFSTQDELTAHLDEALVGWFDMRTRQLGCWTDYFDDDGVFMTELHVEFALLPAHIRFGAHGQSLFNYRIRHATFEELVDLNEMDMEY